MTIAGAWLALAVAMVAWGQACIDVDGLVGEAGLGGDSTLPDRDVDGGVDAGDAGADTFVGCGPTNKDCLGGGCDAGVCGPARLTEVDAGAASALDIVLFGEHFYYRTAPEGSEPGKIIRCPKIGGCAVERKVLVTSPSWPDVAMAVRADGVYYYEPDPGGAVLARCAIDGTSAPQRLAPVVGDASEQIVVHGNYVYYAGSGSLWSCPVTGCRPPAAGPVALASVTTKGGMALYGSELVFTQVGDATGAGARVVHMQLDGGAAAEFSPPPPHPRWVAYEPTRGVVVATFVVPPQTGKITLFSNTAPAFPVFEQTQNFITVAADVDYVYFTTTTPSGLHRKRWNAPVTTFETLAGGGPFGVAVDEKAIYWADSSPGAGAVYRLAK